MKHKIVVLQQTREQKSRKTRGPSICTFKFEVTYENKADRPTPTPIQKSGDPMVDEDGGGTGTLGEATEVVC